MPATAVDGVRRDVLERVKALRPAFVRWPGGNVAQDYHWLWGVGPRDERVTLVNLSWRNEPEPSDFGTDEYIQFCRNTGAEPSITVNVEGRGATPEEAAAWVEYCNGAPTTKYGAMRAANGHPSPYNVRYWEVGNEIWGSWVRGHSDAETYARNFNRYAKAMRAIDPNIKLIAVGDNDMRWNRTVLSRSGEGIDYLAIHHYYGRREMKGDALNLMARPLHYERFYRVRAVDKGVGAGQRLAPGHQRVGIGFAGRTPVFYGIGPLWRAPDERLRALGPHSRHERRLRLNQRLARRHHTGEPPRPLRDADLLGQRSL